MKHLKVYENFNNSEIDKLCDKYEIKNYKINDDGSIDVNGNVYIAETSLIELPIKFNKINGDFYIADNKLTTLKNCPIYIEGSFYADNNLLTTLLEGPQIIKLNNYSYNIAYTNRYRKLIKGYFCQGNNLKDVYGFPEIYDGPVYTSANDDLKNPIREILFYEYYSLKPASRWYQYSIFYWQTKFIQMLNEYHVIRNGDTIIKDRLEVALEYSGKELPDNIEFKNYKLI